MNKLLLGSTAIGAALLAAPAMAQLEVTIGGSMGFQAGYWDSDSPNDIPPTGDGDGFDFQAESEVIVRANGTADNGLEYGAKIEINTSTTDDAGNSDEVSLFVGGSWGRMEFGDFDSAADEMAVYAPTVGIGQVDGAYTDFAGLANGFFGFKPLDSGDSTKINYYTPRFAGFRFGVSYAPYSDEGEEVVTGDEFEDWIEAGVDYSNTFGGFSVLASGTISTADRTDGVDDNVLGWSAGLQVGFGGFTVGGGYVSQPDGLGGAEPWAASVGVTYTVGPWGVGAQYYLADADGISEGGGITTDEYEAIGVGATYTLAPGLTLGGDVVYWSREDGGGNPDDDGFVVVTEIRAAF